MGRRTVLGAIAGLGVLSRPAVAESMLRSDASGASLTARPASASARAVMRADVLLEGREADELGLVLPSGFSARVVAVAGLDPVDDAASAWPLFPDGAATFAADDGGWFHTVNSEVGEEGKGGVVTLRFDENGEVTDAYRVLSQSRNNCAGGPTPWGTWLSCEEFDDGAGRAGRVFECDPDRAGEGRPLPALGRFSHEAVAADPEGQHLYLSEDQPDGLLYRFTPDEWGDLGSGLLEAAVVSAEGELSWSEVPDPSAQTGNTRYQVPGATTFDGGEGLWYHEGLIWFTTKGDNKVRQIDTEAQTIEVIYEPEAHERLHGVAGPLTGVDNVTVHPESGRAFVAEDGGNMELVVLGTDGRAVPFLRFTSSEHEGSEVTGPCFDPSGRRLYLSSQRARLGGDDLGRYGDRYAGLEMSQGVTYEISGPFADLDGDLVISGGAGSDGAGSGETGSGSGGADSGTGVGGSEVESGDGGADDGESLSPTLVYGAVGAAGATAAAGLGAIALRKRRLRREGEDAASGRGRSDERVDPAAGPTSGEGFR